MEELKINGLVAGPEGTIIKQHTKEDLQAVREKSSALAILNKTAPVDRANLSDLSFDQLVAKQQAGATPPKPISADFCEVGNKKINIVLQRMMNDMYSSVTQPDTKDAAHLSVNVQRSSDSGEYAIIDKELLRDEPAIFKHRSSYVEGESIIQVKPEGQMEATAIIINEGYAQIDTLVNKVTELGNILSVISAQEVKASDPDELKKKALNLLYILNKGSIRNSIDKRILAALPDDEAKSSTKADRYEQVTRIMGLVNDELATFAMSPYVATLELSDWTYSILRRDGDVRGSKAKGRKYFAISETLAMKVDMRGSRAGGKYPIPKSYIEKFKKEAAKIQELYLLVMENQVREDLGLAPFVLPEVTFDDTKILEGLDDEKIVSYILKNNNSEIKVSEIIAEANTNIKNAIRRAFEVINEDRVINNL